MLVGDYDSSELWEELPSFRNVSQLMADAWNDFIEIEEMKVEFTACGCESAEKND